MYLKSVLSAPSAGKKMAACFQVCAIGILVLLGTVSEPHAAELTFGRQLKTVVLDPGHGGEDLGAQGTEGTLEKNVSLTLARIIADACGKQYKIKLTRTGDYGLDLRDRTATANHLKADLFISIHTGGSFRHRAAGMGVYYYEALRKDPQPDSGGDRGDTGSPSTWNRTQRRHEAGSKELATHLHRHLVEGLNPSGNFLKGLPISILQGADMPAVILEVGYVTNPVEEKQLVDSIFLAQTAEAVCRGIAVFFNAPR